MKFTSKLFMFAFTLLALAAIAHAQSPREQLKVLVEQFEQAAKVPAGGETFRDCADCADMVVIPAGSFEMGSSSGDEDEAPPHRVTLKSFALGKTEVTQAQW